MVSDKGVWVRCIVASLLASGLTAAIMTVLPGETLSSSYSSPMDTTSSWQSKGHLLTTGTNGVECSPCKERPPAELKPWFPKDPNPMLDEYVPNYNTGPLLMKWSHYFDIYHRHLAKYRGTNVTMIEVGVQSGGSLLMWKWYFGPQSRIIGIDINPNCKQFEKPDQNVSVMIGDQADKGFWERVRSTVGHYDIFLDDGGHKMIHQTTTFNEMYPSLSSQGVFICEDTHTSYWPEFDGGYKGQTFVEYMKDHVDKINAFHNVYRERLGMNGRWPLQPDEFTYSTDNVHFYDSVIVIEKMPREPAFLVSKGDYTIPY